MNTLQDSNKFSDFLRLANLRGLTNSRLRGREDQKFSDMQNPDLAGAAMDLPPPLMPEQIPGNFDVRANQKIEPPPVMQGPAAADNDSIWSKLMNIGGAGARMIGGGEYPQDDEMPMSQATAIPAPKDLTEKSPLPTLEQARSLISAQPSKDILKERVPQEVNDMARNAMISPQSNQDPMAMISMLPNLLMQGQQEESLQPPMEMPQNQAMGNAQLNQNLTELPQPEQAPTNLGGETQVGAINEVMENPTLKSRIDEIFGPIDPSMAQSALDYEKAMDAYANGLDDVTANLNERERAIKQRIESRQLSTTDKILMALALIAPVIAAGFIGGKEALIGALSGGTKGISELFNARAKENKEGEEELSQLSLDKAKIAKEKAGIHPLTAEFRAKVAESIPNKELREIFSRDGEMIGNNLIINSGNPNLPIKAEAIRDVKDYNRIKKEIPKFAQTLSSTEQSMQIIDGMHKLLDAANAGKEGLGNKLASFFTLGLYDNLAGVTKAYIPWTHDTVKDENGNVHKISALYNTLRTQLSEIWRKSNAGQSSSNAFRATEEHFFNQLPDPFSKEAFKAGLSDINQSKKQLDLVKDKFTRNVVTYLDEQGIDTSRISQMLSGTERNKELSEQERRRNRANQAAEQFIRGK